MTKNQDTVISLVLMQMQPGEVVDEEKIKGYVQVFRILNPLTDEEEEEVIKELHSKLAVRMDRGACIKEKNHISWYYAAKKDIPQQYWQRYMTYLAKEQGFNKDVVNKLDEATDEMMDMLGNPKSEMTYSRRGLVIGDVQSGKTSTYTALINKAADSGYKIIILLTGTIEKLRQQTQGRLDAGFTGLDSTAFLKDKEDIFIGVGEIDSSFSGWSITSTTNDFNTKAAQQFIGQLLNIEVPVLFVLKKNKSVLANLEQWLKLLNKEADGKIHKPMLLIDDEADNASVNTKKPDDMPSAINAGIRKLLELFTRSNYVAFTATPFANIFINPDTNDEMLNDDLFPRDFIYALEPPTNYIGARSIFSDEGKYHYMLKNNDDCEIYLPEKHNKTYEPSGLPMSLREAIASFFIANAIRDLRGHMNSHRTMLINISRFIDVQEEIRSEVDGYVRELQREIELYSMTGDNALRHEGISFIKNVYDTHYASLSEEVLDGEKKYEWKEVLKVLYPAVASIVVRTVNGGNASKNLNYDECEDGGLRLIAIGGFSLSRGLTLEGLAISYFHRNSKMYDTLMQMGRWFGYRPHYADVCQIWMSDVSVDWYEYISEATDELRHEVRKMRDQGLTPREFGLGVRSDKDALLVTAVNKMRYTEDIPMTISLSGEVVETPYIYLDGSHNKQNVQIVNEWLNDLISHKYCFSDGTVFEDGEKRQLALGYPQILGVPKEKIIDLLRNYKSHYLNWNFRTSDLIALIENDSDKVMDTWDVLIAEGSMQEEVVFERSIKPIKRVFSIKSDKNALQMSGKGARLGSSNHGWGGLSTIKVKEIEAAVQKTRTEYEKNKAFSQEDYFTSGYDRHPLITIYPVKLALGKNDTEEKIGASELDAKKELVNSPDNLYVGLSIGIPDINGKERKSIKYTINLVKWRELLEVDDDYVEETGVED